jgi:Domain of Unknown Function (DUF1259)
MSRTMKLALIALLVGWAGTASAANGRWDRVGEALGKPGTIMPGGIYKIALPITGDFVLTAMEVAPVMKALRDNGIEVTAPHNHMIDEQPRLFFMHFWAHDNAAKLARGLKAALPPIAGARG